jgi:capsular exopolysaccharide synthesis family protein
MLGVGFVLVVDNLEDTVINLSDVEGRLALKVLAVLPHLRNKKRKDVARVLIDERYSHFSESVAGLRNLFESPRYEAMTKCILVISTQPGEGKTITSTSLAIAYAQSGKKTLHVDFDLRRPRVAGIWGFELTKERSFSHVLQSSISGDVDFSQLLNKTELDNLDIVASLPPEGVTPAQIFGSGIITGFFEWARANYDRIIVDAPPYGVVGDVVTLAMLVDSTVIMCCPDRSHFKPIQYCSRCLTEAGANILGVIVNDVEVAQASAFSVSPYSTYGDAGYGYGYKSDKYLMASEGEDNSHGEFEDEE